MKFSSCITNSNIFELDFDFILSKFIAYGFDAIDIPGDIKRYPIDKVSDIIESYSNKIEVGEITAMMNPSLDLVHPDKKKRDIAVDYVFNCIEAAASLGANMTHLCFLSFPDNLKNTPKKIMNDRALESLKRCINHAEENNIKLMIEPLYKGDISIVNRCEQAVELLSKALNMDKSVLLEGKTRYGLLQDIFHMHNEEKDILETIEKYGAMTYHMHVADHIRSLDFNRKDSNFVKDSIKLLKNRKYKGIISFESFHESVDIDSIGASLKTIKSF